MMVSFPFATLMPPKVVYYLQTPLSLCSLIKPAPVFQISLQYFIHKAICNHSRQRQMLYLLSLKLFLNFSLAFQKSWVLLNSVPLMCIRVLYVLPFLLLHYKLGMSRQLTLFLLYPLKPMPHIEFL